MGGLSASSIKLIVVALKIFFRFASARDWVGKKIAGNVEDFFAKTTIADLLNGNPRASAEAREMIHSIRNPNQRSSHGSVA